ncbi:RNA polymerase sigma factor [Actinoplanes sp. RD1]|uniref:RNA polymerase sigma factor n=1 Tax=Actinoplanes sp. RD1 TaxID=3064538 RepID=UPI0027403B47|nr:sigma-70 family RNA polymerase sigma factor [Actinoplanes sp. RD1]
MTFPIGLGDIVVHPGVAVPASLPDEALWPLITTGHHEAFTILYERHAEAVWNYAYRLTASWSDADDLLSVVFLTAWRRRRDLRLVHGSALPWLYVVTVNVCRGERRRLARLWRALPRLLGPDTPDHAERLVEQDTAGRRLRRVLAAVDRLPRAEREAVQLCLLGDTPVEDAAAMWGISPSSVHSRLTRARTRLHDLVPEDHDA